MSDPIAAIHRFTVPAEPLAVLLVGFERLDADALAARLARLAQRTPIPRDLAVVACPTADAEAVRRAVGSRPGRQIAVVCLGERYPGEEARRLIASHDAARRVSSGAAGLRTAGGAARRWRDSRCSTKPINRTTTKFRNR
jgi:hypothetical protein